MTTHRHDTATVAIGPLSAAAIVRIPADATIRDVAEELVLDEVGALVVAADHADHGAAGIVSERDVVTVLALGDDPDARRARDVMVDDLVAVAPRTTVRDVGILMIRSGVRHVLVEEEDVVLGIVSQRDVLAVLLDVDG